VLPIRISCSWFIVQIVNSRLLVTYRWARRHRGIVLLLLLVSVNIPPTVYEYWRFSVESQIQGQIASMNYPADTLCSYIVSNAAVMDYYYGKVHFYEGGAVNRTIVSSWQTVLSYSAFLRGELLKASQPCKMFFGLTRTVFVLLFHRRDGPGFFTTVDLVYSKYAPF